MGDITVYIQNNFPTATADIFQYQGYATCEGMDESSSQVQWTVNFNSNTVAATINPGVVEAAITAAAAGSPSYTVGPTDKKTLVNPVVDIVIT